MKVEDHIARRVGLNNFSVRGQIIRDERGFRLNELNITYCWMIQIDIQLGQRGGLFGIKLKENHFREHHNPDALILGIYIQNEGDHLVEFHSQKRIDTLIDPVKELSRFNLFNAGDNLTIDGVLYHYRIVANNIDTRLTLSNPHSPEFKSWEAQVHKTWNELAIDSKSQKLMGFWG